MKICSLKAW